VPASYGTPVRVSVTSGTDGRVSHRNPQGWFCTAAIG
jgi:hypothetical protein